MLQLTIKARELFNEKTAEFYNVPETTMVLEHSLYAIAMWECKYEKSYFSKVQKTEEELLDYIRFMTINDVDDYAYLCLTRSDFDTIAKYINRPMSGRTYNNKKKKGYSFITAEDIYYQMAMNGIPFECEKWHLNRLMSLLYYCNIHNSDGKKMNKREQSQMYAELNAARRKALGSKG